MKTRAPLFREREFPWGGKIPAEYRALRFHGRRGRGIADLALITEKRTGTDEGPKGRPRDGRCPPPSSREHRTQGSVGDGEFSTYHTPFKEIQSQRCINFLLLLSWVEDPTTLFVPRVRNGVLHNL